MAGNPYRVRRSPPAPKRLSARAAAEWKALAPICILLRTLTTADLRALEMLCNLLAAEAECREVLARDGMTVGTGAGGLKPHPAVRMAEAAGAQAAALLQQFGLTPRSRRNSIGRWDWDKEDSYFDDLPDDDDDDDP
jgi:P27 family predicted phage terminase small subunit